MSNEVCKRCRGKGFILTEDMFDCPPCPECNKFRGPLCEQCLIKVYVDENGNTLHQYDNSDAGKYCGEKSARYDMPDPDRKMHTEHTSKKKVKVFHKVDFPVGKNDQDIIDELRAENERLNKMHHQPINYYVEEIEQLKEELANVTKICEMRGDSNLALGHKINALIKALRECANHAWRETNGKTAYESDTYGYILKIAKKALLPYKEYK